MNLKGIEISGFKSFANRVKLDFPRGITAIVGPNGCGKTNVIEAVRWVLGEQNVRTLRGERMEEVIFNGTAQRKPLGMAEVKLHFDDPEQEMGLDADEFTIGRQIFRSGESNYIINSRNCRLKDIQDLFMDTGMGSNAYSMIEQRMVEAVLSERAEERRFLFEEAAGIQKYKVRRKYALRKLENTEGDLQRINDIVSEVQRTVNSLQRQVRKARNYRRLSGKLRRVAVTLARDELARLHRQRAPLATRLAKVQDRLAALAADESTRAARSEELRTRINDRQRSAEELFARLGEVNRQVRAAEDELTVNREKQRSGTEWIAEGGQRLETLVAKIEGRREELEKHRGLLEKQREQTESCEQEYRAAREAAEEKAETLDSAREELSGLQARRENILHRSSSLASRASALEDAVAYENKRADELGGQAGELGREHGEAGSELESLEREAAELAGQRKARASDLRELEDNLEQRRAEQGQLREKLSRASLERESLAGEKDLLERMQREMEGYDSGVKALFTNGADRKGIEGVAGEIFKTESRYERAVEAALGLRLQSVVTRDTRAMLEAIGYLRDTGSGSATFISRDLVNGYRANGGRPEGGNVLAWCEEVVRCDSRYEFLRKLLFSGVAIVEDLGSAVELQKKSEKPLHLVTLAGETMCDYVVSGGGSGAGGSGAAILERKRKLEEIEQELAEAGGRMESLEEELAACDAEMESLAGQRQELRGELDGIVSAHEALKARVADKTVECRSLLSRKQSAESQLSQAREKAGQLAAEQKELSAGAVAAGAELGELEHEIEKAREGLKVYENISRRESEALQEVSTRLTEKRTRLSEAEKSLVLLERELEAAGAESGALENELEARREGLGQLASREEELRGVLEGLFERREELEQERAGYEETLAGLRSEADELDRRLSDLRREKETFGEERHTLEMDLEKITSRRELVLQRIRDGHGIDMDEVPEDFLFFPDEEEAEKGEEAGEELVEQLQERIRRLGPVNEGALEEYEQEKERLDFLQQQRDDLMSARESLLELIGEINKTARARFLDTFSKVQNNFQEIFTSLFEGGAAHVSLADESDPLESPIEVIARPRGKKMLGLGLLSGGEKALTALALLFAIYSVKPSPFCILDEADAPLDDANIDRFLSIIRRFSRRTQFIIVTHNKRTMEFADCLYGVTMQDAGVSRVVSVRLSQVGEGGRIRQLEPETQPAD